MKLLTRLQLIILVLSTIAADQASKIIVRQTMFDTERIEVIDNYLVLHRLENEGAFLGMGNDLSPGVRLMALTILPLAIIVLAFVYLLRTKKTTRLAQTGLALLIGGGVGNLFDRMVYGSVTDFFFMDFGVFHTGIFNVGDMAIMAGVAMMLIASYKKPKRVAAQSLAPEDTGTMNRDGTEETNGPRS